MPDLTYFDLFSPDKIRTTQWSIHREDTSPMMCITNARGQKQLVQLEIRWDTNKREKEVCFLFSTDETGERFYVEKFAGLAWQKWAEPYWEAAKLLNAIHTYSSGNEDGDRLIVYLCKSQDHL